ncbi:hypothetical protein HMI55_003586 [Coelomomyces lativittatus]|nr:hypothetical protein HMI56_004599 [Coelomomyces lativittatus]KAJ1501086.1 hypothetical protein HMI55_003586 [Coelomomyces lativittatus]
MVPGFNEWRLRRNLKKRLALLLNNNTNFPVFEFKRDHEDGEGGLPSNSILVTPSSTTSSSSSSTSTLLFNPNLSQRFEPCFPSSNTLPSFSSTRITCSICLEDYQLGDPIRELPCRHDFHIICIQPWLERAILENSVICPVCRSVWDIPSTPIPSRFSFSYLKLFFYRFFSLSTRETRNRRTTTITTPSSSSSSSSSTPLTTLTHVSLSTPTSSLSQPRLSTATVVPSLLEAPPLSFSTPAPAPALSLQEIPSTSFTTSTTTTTTSTSSSSSSSLSCPTPTQSHIVRSESFRIPLAAA